MEYTKEKTVGSFVAEDYRAANVFQKYGIDFCCRGNISLQEVSDLNKLDANKLIEELKEAVKAPDANEPDFRTWPLDELADYIVKKHHAYITKSIPLLNQYLDKICQVHGDRHPELLEIKKLFNTAAANLEAHLQKEERMLFPYINKLADIKKNGLKEKVEHGVWTVQNPVRVMMMEHDAEGERFRIMSQLSNGYTTPSDGCRTYQVTFSMLKEFESDLHRHIHLENNILFPGAIALENELF